MKPSVLFIDIETAPSIGYTWGPKWETSIIEFIEPWYMLSMAYKWLGGKKTKVMALPDYEDYKPGYKDKELTKDIVDLLSRADIVIAHNGDRFDIKKINTRALIHRISPPEPFKTVDTRKVAKARYGFDSNSLNDLAKQLGLKPKVETGGFSLWLGCIGGDLNAWRKMKLYNKRDVDLLEEVYMIMRPWITTHPNMGEYSVEKLCRNCGSRNVIYRGRTTLNNRKLQCKDCNHWGQERINKVKKVGA